MAEEKTNQEQTPEPTKSAPEAKPKDNKEGNWLTRHKVLAIVVGGIIGLIIIAIVLGGGSASFNVSVGGPSAECHYEDKDLCKFLNKLTEIDSVSVEMAGSTDGTLTKSTIKIQGDNKTQIITTANGTELNIITIDNIIYAKQSDGTWNKYIDEKGELDIKSNTDWKGDIVKSLDESSQVTYEKVGKEKCGDLNCFKYKAAKLDSASVNTFLFFDDKKFLMRKATTETNGETMEAIYSYDDINISEPSPAKEVASPSELYGGIGL